MTEIDLIQALAYIPQDPKWHPEGNALIHTNLVIDQAIKIAERDNFSYADLTLLWKAAMFHDTGKINTTKIVTAEGSFAFEQYFFGHREFNTEEIIKITSYGHPQESAKLARLVMSKSTVYPTEKPYYEPEFIEAVAILCDTHMNYDITTEKAIRKLQVKLAAAGTTLTVWAALIEADHSGRHPLPPTAPGNAVLDLAKVYGVTIL